MTRFFRGMFNKMGIVGELFGFLWKRKLWWLLPPVILLMVLGLLLIFTASSGFAPFIYTLF